MTLYFKQLFSSTHHNTAVVFNMTCVFVVTVEIQCLSLSSKICLVSQQSFSTSEEGNNHQDNNNDFLFNVT